jgi:PAS domain S-box-containing protein
MFFIIRFISAWVIWILFADKSRWREILPVAIFGSFLALTTDIIVISSYTLWAYHDGANWRAYLLDDWGIYLVTVYLFIQWLPHEQTLRNMFVYWFGWTGICIGIEWLHLITGHMSHYKWWNLGWSYLSGWVLFWLFYQFHKQLRLAKLSPSADQVVSATHECDINVSFVELSPLPIIAINKQQKVIIWNPAAERLLGWSKQEVLGSRIPIIPREEEETFQLRASAKLSGQTFHHVQLNFQRKDGMLIKLTHSALPLYGLNGEIIGSMAIITQIVGQDMEQPSRRLPS